MKLRYIVPYVLVSAFQYQFSRDMLNYTSPLIAMGLRYLVAGLIMLAFSRRVILNRDVALVSCFSSLSTSLWIYGLKYVSFGASAVLSYSQPIFAVPLAWALIREKPSKREVLGALIGFAGAFIFTLPSSRGYQLLGSLLTLGAAVSGATFSIYFRKMRGFKADEVVGSHFVLGSIPMFAFSPLLGFYFKPEPPLWLDLGYVSTLSGVVLFYTWNLMLREDSVGKVTTTSFAVPITTLLLQTVETSVPPTILSLIGVAVMFLGIYIANSEGIWVRRAKIKGTRLQLLSKRG